VGRPDGRTVAARTGEVGGTWACYGCRSGVVPSDPYECIRHWLLGAGTKGTGGGSGPGGGEW